MNNTSNFGTVYKISPSGVVTILHSFGDGSVANDGDGPVAALVQGSDGDFYGTTTSDAFFTHANVGTVFKITPSGTVTTLHVFGDGSVANDGAHPSSALIQGSDGSIYGTTSSGGSANLGTVFKMTPSGTVTILHSFGDGSVANDGANPGAIIQGADGNLYGTTPTSTGHYGTIFEMTTSGTETILHVFTDGIVSGGWGNSQARLVEGADGNFYGTTTFGGASNGGAAFRMTPAGAVTILHSFATPSTLLPMIGDDGIGPTGLIQGSDGNFYGTTVAGGPAGTGVVFRLTPSGTETVLYSFPNWGAYTFTGAVSPVIQGTDGNLYGTTKLGGADVDAGLYDGMVYRLALAAAPVFNPPAGRYTAAQSVTISDTTPGVSIYYTTDGSTPTPSSTAYTGGMIPVTHSETLQAIAVENGYTSSAVSSASYTISLDAPTELTATAGNGSVALAWTGSTGATSYNVYVGTSAGRESAGALSTVTGTNYTVTGLRNGTTYYFVVKAVNAVVSSAASNEASAMPQAPVPTAPTNLVAIGGDGSVSLTWTASAEATSYTVYEGTSAGGESSTPVATGLGSTSYAASGLTNGTTYYFVVTASNSTGTSGFSTEVSATPQVVTAVPAAPTGLAATAGNGSVSLTWTAAAGSTSYSVYDGTTAGGENLTPAATGVTSTSYTASGLMNGKTYYFVVTASNSIGTSGFSNEASAAPQAGAGTISYPAGVQFISTPLDFSSTPLDILFGISGLKLAVWQPTLLAYEVSPNAPADKLRLGVGYWVNLPNAVTLDGTGTAADTTQDFSISLSEGWNQIGDPFFTTVPVTSLTVDGSTFAQATSGVSPLVSSTIYGYDGTKYVTAASIAPQSGYWVYAYQNCTLSVPHP